MRLDGKALAETILTHLRTRVAALKQRRVTPTLAVIQVGDDPASTAYIRQKQKAADGIGVKLIVSNQESGIRNQELQMLIDQYNHDPNIHGIIVQRPLPKGLKTDSILPIKDVDGFLLNSPYPVPVAMAVQKILEEVFHTSSVLRHKSYVILGRGDTAGKPIADMLMKQGGNITVVHSQTLHPNNAMRAADILISCVGKPNVVRRDTIKKGAILLSVGITRGSDGKLHGDYEEDQIRDHASLYTPTPGGVGPVNVACLMENLVQAATNVL